MKPKDPQVPESEQLEIAGLATGSSTLNIPTKAAAEALADRLTQGFARQFQRMRDPAMLQSGQDSGLKSVWDEICVQKQAFESVGWRAYERMIELMITVTVEGLSSMERQTIWILTETGGSWHYDVSKGFEPDEDEAVPVDEELTQMLTTRLLSYASDYENVRIRRYLDRPAW